MYFTSFQLENYKSHRVTPKITLEPGINIISGQNNAGKTALLEGLSLMFSPVLHRSLESVPTRNTVPPSMTIVRFGFVATSQELREILLRNGTQFQLPRPEPNDPIRLLLNLGPSSGVGAELVNWFLSEDREFKLELRRNNPPGGDPSAGQWYTSSSPSYGRYSVEDTAGNKTFFVSCVVVEGEVAINGNPQGPKTSDVGVTVGQHFARSVYCFRAERFNAGSCAFGPSPVLEANARNLAEVLNVLQSNRERFRRFNVEVGKILPQVRQIAVHPVSNGRDLEILVWSHEPASEREDLAVPLNESGTGIGQVLAILYVVMTSDYPRTIIIDEPQSFLHAGAVRKLIEVLRTSGDRHQFIIATHSPTIISAASPKTITLLTHDGTETKVQTIDTEKTEELRTYLAEIGVHLADVFGADNVLWVEGATEEQCFPRIVEQLIGKPLMGTLIRGVLATGDLEGKQGEAIVKLYERLSTGTSLLPPALGFVFDDEGRTDTEKSELRKRTRGRIQFTQRRMYENYLLHAEAIASIANGIQGFRESQLTAEEVEACLDKLLNGFENKIAGIKGCDGAKVLNDLFAELSENRVSYRKVVHGVALTEWLLRNRPEELQGLAELLETALRV